MKQLELNEMELVVGGGRAGQVAAEVGRAIGAWVVEKAADAASNAVGNLNQGGSPAYTDQLGNVT